MTGLLNSKSSEFDFILCRTIVRFKLNATESFIEYSYIALLFSSNNSFRLRVWSASNGRPQKHTMRTSTAACVEGVGDDPASRIRYSAGKDIGEDAGSRVDGGYR